VAPTRDAPAPVAPAAVPHATAAPVTARDRRAGTTRDRRTGTARDRRTGTARDRRATPRLSCRPPRRQSTRRRHPRRLPRTTRTRLYAHVYTAGSGKETQQVAVFVSPGITEAPNLFIFLHGHDAQMQIDNDAQHKGKSGVLSGIDVAAEATKSAKNTVTLVPQGVIGGARRS